MGPDNLWAAGWGLKRFGAVPPRNLEGSDDGSIGTLSVLDADWSVIAKFERVFDLMSINELYKFTIIENLCRFFSCSWRISPL